jgi:hypothetical protein
MSRPGSEPGPPAREASTLEKSHLDSLSAGYSEPLLGLRLAPFIQIYSVLSESRFYGTFSVKYLKNFLLTSVNYPVFFILSVILAHTCTVHLKKFIMAYSWHL